MIAFALCLLVLPALLPAFALLALTLAALAQRRIPAATGPGCSRAPRVAVLVPAHDESTHVLPTIASVQAQLGPDDRLLVVADNCSDDTALLASAAGATVAERSDAARRGKGHALAFGVERLRADPPDVLLVVDADCVLDEGALAAAAHACHRTGRPVQMLNLMHAPAGAGLRLRVLEFAMRMKNLVRPLGTARLGGVTQLMGTGMALPWALASHARFATGHVAEDMLLGVELTRDGHAPLFQPQLGVHSPFVEDSAVARRQKARWEHGHLDTLRHELPPLAGAALRRRDRALGALAMDLMIPPLALYFWAVAALVVLAAAGAAFWPAARPAAGLVAAAAGAFGLAVLLAWWHFGRDVLQARELLRLPLYALWKLPVYVAYAAGFKSGWVRTQRSLGLPSANTRSDLS